MCRNLNKKIRKTSPRTSVVMSTLAASWKVKRVELAMLLCYEVKGNAGSRATSGQMNDLCCQCYSEVRVLREGDLNACRMCSRPLLNFLLPIYEFSICVYTAVQVTCICAGK